ncbi:unnamed protein product [Aphanomyces euteiches]|uniref:Endonuclease/exonuclease/phosphatase domain-containing protein n=1 Tax=Aphanomyces euteiches TaxID=100861 RepID=A0A6G0WC41_9STRA|nr:hypothetical protein Ae201684_016577 [Aphanomyces euteiches]KAH9084136.1 hypothetical protein Ae201684P_020391 [Aphanomyces euteiches]KAH9144506.1 hypothetical protein AeRB84_011559 [Aphanomyces euteiches]
MVRLVVTFALTAVAAASSIQMLTMNTLCVDDSFNTGWGTVGEMQRRDELVASGLSDAEARAFLLKTRYERVANFLRDAQRTHNVLALQEMDLLDVSSPEYLLKHFAVENGPWKVACNVASPTEQEMVLINTDELRLVKNSSWTEEGVVGCAAKVEFVHGTDAPLTLMSFHMKAGFIRNPDKLNATLTRFINTMPDDDSAVIAGGDFNVNIPDLVARLKILNSNYSWGHRTASNGTDLGFTTQHEYNFLGAYDGFITRNYASRTHDSTKVWQQGFMPKYLGDNATTHGKSPFRYAGGPYPSVEGDLLFIERNLGAANWANVSLSDHMAVSSSFYSNDAC